MTKRFVIGVDNTTADEDKKFCDFLDENQCSWWHWVDNLWLVIDTSDELKADEIRDALGLAARGKSCLVTEVEGPTDWAGFGPSGKGAKKNMFDWLDEKWKD